MDLGDFWVAIAEAWKRGGTEQRAAMGLLSKASHLLGAKAPPTFMVKGSGGQSTPTFTPWVAFLDPRETTTPQRGLYVVYLLSKDLSKLTLSLNQGITMLVAAHGRAQAKTVLRERAAFIRATLPTELLEGLDPQLDLASNDFRQAGYQAGNVASRTYSIADLPEEDALLADLSRFLDLYDVSVSLRGSATERPDGTWRLPPFARSSDSFDPALIFRPKSAEEYVSRIRGRVLRKTRKHEALIKEYGMWADAAGLRPATNRHPIDLTLNAPAGTWMVEAKTSEGSNPMFAVRSALGQLLCYRHFLYKDETPRMLGLFDGPVGEAYVEFLNAHDVRAVWWTPHGWKGCPLATREGLCDGAAYNAAAAAETPGEYRVDPH